MSTSARIGFEHRNVKTHLFGAPLDREGKHLVVGDATAYDGDETWDLLLTLYSNGLLALGDGDNDKALSPDAARRLAGYLVRAADESEAILAGRT